MRLANAKRQADGDYRSIERLQGANSGPGFLLTFN